MRPLDWKGIRTLLEEIPCCDTSAKRSRVVKINQVRALRPIDYPLAQGSYDIEIELYVSKVDSQGRGKRAFLYLILRSSAPVFYVSEDRLRGRVSDQSQEARAFVLLLRSRWEGARLLYCLQEEGERSIAFIAQKARAGKLETYALQYSCWPAQANLYFSQLLSGARAENADASSSETDCAILGRLRSLRCQPPRLAPMSCRIIGTVEGSCPVFPRSNALRHMYWQKVYLCSCRNLLAKVARQIKREEISKLQIEQAMLEAGELGRARVMALRFFAQVVNYSLSTTELAEQVVWEHGARWPLALFERLCAELGSEGGEQEGERRGDKASKSLIELIPLQLLKIREQDWLGWQLEGFAQSSCKARPALLRQRVEKLFAKARYLEGKQGRDLVQLQETLRSKEAVLGKRRNASVFKSNWSKRLLKVSVKSSL